MQKLELIRLILDNQPEKLDSLSGVEMSVFRRILAEEQWRGRGDSEKQADRKASLSSWKKLASQDDVVLRYEYPIAVIEFYDLLVELIDKVQLVSCEHNSSMKRLEAILIIEKDFINEKNTYQRNRHVPYDVLEGVCKREVVPEIEVEVERVLVAYKTMVGVWPDAPKDPEPES